MKALILITVFFHLFLAGNAQTKDNALFDKAENLFKQAHIEGDYTGWQKADSIFSELQQRKGFASVEKKLLAGLYQISIAVRSNADPAQSLKLVDNYIETYYAENLKNSYIIQKLLFWREHLRLRLDKPDAIQNLKNQISWHLDQENLNFEILANLNDVLARYYYGQREFKKSINYGKKAIKNYKNTSLNDLYISSLQFTGGLYYNIDKIDSCLYYMQDAYKLMKAAKSPNNLRLSQLAFNLGMIYQGKTGEFIEAEHHLKEAVEFEIKANGEESPTLITYYSLLADNFYFIKDLEQAAYYALKGYLLANDIVKTESVYLRSLPSMSFSRIYARKGDFGKARQVIDRVVEESIDFFGHNHTFTTQVFIDKAYVEHLAGDFDEAEKYFLAAVSAGEETGRLYSKLSAYASLTAMYLENEDYEKALYYSKKALLLKEREQSTGYTLNAVLYLYKVKSYLGLGDLEAAEKWLLKADKTIKNDINAKILQTEALAIRNAILLAGYQNTGKAETLSEAYNNIDDLIKKIISGKGAYNYQDSKLFYSKSISPYIHTAVKIAEAKYTSTLEPDKKDVLNTIFRLMEINKSSILLDGIIDSRIKAEKGVPQSLADKENSIRTTLININKEVHNAWQDTTFSAKKLNTLIDKQLALNSSLDSIYAHLKADFPSYYEAKNLVSAKKISHYQNNVLKKNQILVEYYFGKSNLYRLVFTKNDVFFNTLENAGQIKSDTEMLIDNLLAVKDVVEVSKRLGKAVLPDFSKDIKDIIIVADGILNQIPFEILHYENGYLLEKFNVSYAGSVQLYEEQVNIAQNLKGKAGWTGFAPDYSDTFLPNNRREVETIKGLMSGKAVLGNEATKANFLEMGNNTGILHLATHSDLNNLNPMLSKMIFYGDSHLTASEIYGLDLNAKMAVLSACNTGIGKFDAGDGVMAMSRAFAYAGVSSTVMSLWKVPDKETSELMILFYENLKKGQAKNEALRNAKLTYLKQVAEPELQHPFYWAGFVVSGDISPVFEEKSAWWIYVIIGITVLVLVIYFIRRRKN